MPQLENYKRERLTIDLFWANIFGIIILIPVALVFGVPYYFIREPEINIIGFFKNAEAAEVGIGFVRVFGFLILGIIFHELLHGITWARFAKNGFKSIKFGVLWKLLTPYCHCKEPLTVNHYIVGAVTPAIILGIVPAVVAIVTGNLGLLIFGIYFTMAASGDFLVINLVRKEAREDLVQDHPSEAGCYIYRKTE